MGFRTNRKREARKHSKSASVSFRIAFHLSIIQQNGLLLLLLLLLLRLTGRTCDLLQFTFNFRNYKTFRLSGRGIGATYSHYLPEQLARQKCICVPSFLVGFEPTIPEFTCAYCDRPLSSFSSKRLSAFLIFPDRPACPYLISLANPGILFGGGGFNKFS